MAEIGSILEAGEVARSPAAGHAVAIHSPPPPLPVPYPCDVPVRSSATTPTIHRVPGPLLKISPRFAAPIAVAIGPYHHGSPWLQPMEEAKRVARDEFCRVAALAGHTHEAIKGEILALEANARSCYYQGSQFRDRSSFNFSGIVSPDYDAYGGRCSLPLSVDEFVEMMFLDGCFLLQFMAACFGNRNDTPAEGGFWEKVHASFDAIVRDVMLLENQIPWFVLQVLMNCIDYQDALCLVDSLLDLMASSFDVGNDVAATQQQQQPQPADVVSPPPPHLLGLFHRRQVGEERAQSLRVPKVASLYGTAVELAEMGIKITTSKDRGFGNMTMTKRRPCLGLYGELALAPVVLNNRNACWLFNMLAYEACLGASCADNFAVSSYISLVSMLMNRREDVQELRGKGVVVSEFTDKETLETFKKLAAEVRVGYRYYHVFKLLQAYRQERWVWIAAHGFLYRNFKTIVAVLSVVGVLAGLFKTIMSVKQHQRG